MSRYEPLRRRLADDPGVELRLRFDEIDTLVGGLPASARDHRAWWGNHRGNPQANAWLGAGRRVLDVNLIAELVRFSPASHSPASARTSKPDGSASQADRAGPAPPDAADPTQAGPSVAWGEVWPAVTETLRAYLEAGMRHLLTEDVIRFATVRALVDAGVDPSRLAVEHRLPAIAASIDLVVDRPPTAHVELKYPRDPEGAGAADTLTLGELLRDLYRLAWLDQPHSYALQVYEPRLRRFLARRTELTWTWTVGDTLELPAGLPDRLPATASRALPPWTVPMEVSATPLYVGAAGDLTVVAYAVAGA